jgi:O-antigen ligase
MRVRKISARASVSGHSLAPDRLLARWPEYGLDACAFLFLPLLVLASRGATALAAVAGLLGLVLALTRGGDSWTGLRGAAALLAALVAWGFASALWAIEPQRSVLIAARLAGLFAAALALTAGAQAIAAPRRLLICLVGGLVVALVLTAVQFATHGELTGPLFRRVFVTPALNQADTGFALLILPLAAALRARGRTGLATALALVTGAAILLLVDTTVKAGFVAGIAAAVLIYLARGPITRLAAAVSVVVIVTAPLTFPTLIEIGPVQQWAQGFYKSSARHRLQIWSFTGAHIAEQPLLGWGLDSSRAIPGGSSLTPQGVPWLPLHPHNMALQIWLELGLPGALLFALFVAHLWLGLATPRWPRLFAAAAGGSLAAVLTIGLGSYGMWQEWWIGTEVLALFLILVMGRLAAHPMPETARGSIS